MPTKKTYVNLNSMLAIRHSGESYIMYCQKVEELARLGVELLVNELGTEGARLVLRDEFMRYLKDYKGVERDHRFARTDRPDIHADQRKRYMENLRGGVADN
ncbi:hypothetical protein ABIC88_004385 [Pseudomonas kilonensis]